jgi:hypothetical protein
MAAKHLIGQHLEHIPRKALEQYPAILRDFVRGRNGIYVLYSRDHLYYVGLAKNLHSRLKQHLRDKHGESWDSLSVYFTVGNVPLREFEALLLRVASPKGNTQKGRFLRSVDLISSFNRTVREFFRTEGDALTGRTRPETVSFQEELEGRKPSLSGYQIVRKNLRWTYKGKVFKARVLKDGKILFAGKRFNSPSRAATHITKRAMNGWVAWSFERAPGDWIKIDWLRKKG